MTLSSIRKMACHSLLLKVAYMWRFLTEEIFKTKEEKHTSQATKPHDLSLGPTLSLARWLSAVPWHVATMNPESIENLDETLKADDDVIPVNQFQNQ
ncbi:unnamed protein product [Lupinus luteus]|uniref:Uncharacterized protein n=1 Tax=Lupinus luteus TaxID=3873 RepID=A0AAV1WT06_LUPLU